MRLPLFPVGEICKIYFTGGNSSSLKNRNILYTSIRHFVFWYSNKHPSIENHGERKQKKSDEQYSKQVTYAYKLALARLLKYLRDLWEWEIVQTNFFVSGILSGISTSLRPHQMGKRRQTSLIPNRPLLMRKLENECLLSKTGPSRRESLRRRGNRTSFVYPRDKDKVHS